MLRTIPKLNVNSAILREIKNYARYATKPAIKEERNYEKELKDFEHISNITQKIRSKKAQKPPFVKNLFLGNFDTDILTYPEISNEDTSNLNKVVAVAENLLQNTEIQNETSKKLLDSLAKSKLLGLQSSQLMDGRELSVTESCRIYEVFAQLKSKNSVIFNETQALLTLTKHASDKIKHKYLQKLIYGHGVASFCYIEPSDVNNDIFRRTATLADDGKSYVLNGGKKMVVNGNSADYFIVLAHTETLVRDTHSEEKLTAFLVERSFAGVSSTRQHILDPDVDIADLAFNNTVVPAENIIGELNGGVEILKNVNIDLRLGVGAICAHINKQLINRAVEHFVGNSKEPLILYETDAVRSVIGQWATSQYALDSMIYMTSGLLDGYENQDCELESAIVKIFSSQSAVENTLSCMNQLNLDALPNSANWCNRLHNEALTQCNLTEPNEALKIFIALHGLRHAGLELNETIKKLRNPMFHAQFTLSRLWTNRRQRDDDPKLNLNLNHYLHPSLLTAANHLEYCVLRLQFATEILFTRFGPGIINQHMDLRRLADVIIDIYGMTSSISRASRSYCIGLQHAENEMVLAMTFANGALGRVKSNISDLLNGMYATNDENYRAISKKVFSCKQYFPVHALTRNF